MRSVVLGFAILLLGASSSKPMELPEIIKIYSSWTQITPSDYSIPGHLSRLCVLPAHPGEIVEDDGTNVPVRVYANDLALTALRTRNPFPIGSVFVKEKHQITSEKETFDFGSIFADNLNVGIMIKSTEGWQFSYYPSARNAAYRDCAACHKTAKHDFVFTPYLKKK